MHLNLTSGQGSDVVAILPNRVPTSGQFDGLVKIKPWTPAKRNAHLRTVQPQEARFMRSILVLSRLDAAAPQCCRQSACNLEYRAPDVTVRSKVPWLVDGRRVS